MVIVPKVFNSVSDFSSHQVYRQVQTNFRKAKSTFGYVLSWLTVSCFSLFDQAFLIVNFISLELT